MEAAFGIVYWIGLIGCGLHYWFTQGRTEQFIVARFKTGFVCFLWPIYLGYLYWNRQNATARQVETNEAKKRILG
jgi:hypothetical protein